MLTVGIDTGGTFTDVFVNSDDGRVATVKAGNDTARPDGLLR